MRDILIKRQENMENGSESVISGNHTFVKEKTIKYLFLNFHDVSDGLELVFIVDFFLKIAEKEEYNYRSLIEKEIQTTKYLEFFLNVFLKIVKLKYETTIQNLSQILVFMKILLKNHEVIDETSFAELQTVIVKWSL